jgi:hypothetical protein
MSTNFDTRHMKVPERKKVLIVHYSVKKNVAFTLSIRNMALLPY